MAASLSDITRDLVRDTRRLRFGAPVTHVYNPLVYARAAHALYLERFGAGRREIILLGMNPGPFGMAQTGIPFGEVHAVHNWLGIHARIGKPTREHPKRPVLGFECPRSEVSGARLWGWARDRFGAPDCFFERFYVANYCPLAFMTESGRNHTPDKLPARERDPLFAACDRALVRTIEHLKPSFVVGIGKFAETRIRAACGEAEIRVGSIPHPSPANPVANRGWAKAADEGLRRLGIRI